ncbi:PREDICTED: epidermal growth factor-like protein 6 isoform X2 [Condylura cristata]|uniref:epidermal growth factor-like protein 6 isoform X2 n=1 Tax=Condylura cristata TaxID=143302 RepID=UPI000642DAD7|nr:PREDICTED: epidermal growth factor-like protein 6 isoform X2 [Condylura cristata]
MLLPWALGLALLLPWAAGGLGNAASARHHGLSALALQPGLCHYGVKLACCYGWRQSSRGVCEAACEPGCKFGECVGPNKCRCFPGYTGKTCSQDVNECGIKPRPCQHRCVNTHGSYKCFCLSGHVLMPDASCASLRTCAVTNCQYGCEDAQEGPRCLCPSSGLRLAPGGRVCIDVDECAAQRAVCPFNRRCINTFGSYYCKCRVGFELQYIGGRYDCVVIPEDSVKKVLRAPGAIKDRIKKLLAHKNSMKKKEKMENVITESAPFDSESTISRAGKPTGGKRESMERKREGLEEEKSDEKTPKSHTEQERRLRGDVFSPKVNEADELDLVLIPKKAVVSKLERKDLNVSVDCSFDHGVCDWKQDTEDDFDWKPADRENAVGYYMAVPASAGQKKDIGRLKLLLHDLQPQRYFCLLFHYRLAGDKVGKLRVFGKCNGNTLTWEEARSESDRWKTGTMQFCQGTGVAKSQIIFEAERGKGKTGEIAVDGVLLVSGWCPAL